METLVYLDYSGSNRVIMSYMTGGAIKMSEKNKVYVDKDLKELIPMFLENRSQNINELRELMEEKKFDEIENLGHKIKGSGGGYGFDRVTDLGRAIEKAAAEEKFDELQELIDEFSEHIEKVEIIYE